MGESLSPPIGSESASAYTRLFQRVSFPRVVVQTILLFLVAVSCTNARHPVLGTVRVFPVPGAVDRMTLLRDDRDNDMRMFFWTSEGILKPLSGALIFRP